jgi:carbon-monoxide dehydrogenase medium subunit
MYPFDYLRPSDVPAAVAGVDHGEAGQYLAGGMTLLPTLKMRLAQPAALVDLGAVADLAGIRVEGARVSVGAMTRHADVAHSPEVRRALPALAELASGIGDPHVRNRGTIGGSVANNDPAADYPAAVLGLAATVVTDRRQIAAADYFRGMFTTALEPGELIVRIDFPVPRRAAYAKFPNPASRYAIAGVFVAETGGGVRVAVTGAGPGVFRASALEAALARHFDPAALAGIAIGSDGLNEDMHASAEYRAALVTVMAQRAVAQALARG